MGSGANTLVARGVNEVSAPIEVGVEKLEAGLLGHGSKAVLLPLIGQSGLKNQFGSMENLYLVADGHRTELQRRNANASIGRKNAIVAEFRRGRWHRDVHG